MEDRFRLGLSHLLAVFSSLLVLLLFSIAVCSVEWLRDRFKTLKPLSLSV